MVAGWLEYFLFCCFRLLGGFFLFWTRICRSASRHDISLKIIFGTDTLHVPKIAFLAARNRDGTALATKNTFLPAPKIFSVVVKRSDILHKFLNKISGQILSRKSQMNYNLEGRE